MYHLQRIKVQPCNAVVLEVLSNRFSFPTSRNTFARNVTISISRKIPMNSVASWTRLTSQKPQLKCIHCYSVSTDKFLTFDKTKYGENIIDESNERK